jgi:hypothetical protein
MVRFIVMAVLASEGSVTEPLMWTDVAEWNAALIFFLISSGDWAASPEPPPPSIEQAPEARTTPTASARRTGPITERRIDVDRNPGPDDLKTAGDRKKTKPFNRDP